MDKTSLHLDTDNSTPAWNRVMPQNGAALRSRIKSASILQSSSSDSEDSALDNARKPAAASNYPHGTKSLSGISSRAFLLGLTVGVASSSTTALLFLHPAWRVTFFLSSLALFHFLEYYLTARYNTPLADISAFLLSRNGRAYNAAHSAAFLECIIYSFLLPSWQHVFSNSYTVPLGLFLMFIGQTARSLGMAEARTNFNHTVQTHHNDGHVLVTTGIYAWLRHPAYFGFFWWALGTQLLLGNCVCLVAYAVLLWRFFRSRTRKEEQLLIEFFGKAYEEYRLKTSVGIPFIR